MCFFLLLLLCNLHLGVALGAGRGNGKRRKERAVALRAHAQDLVTWSLTHARICGRAVLVVIAAMSESESSRREPYQEELENVAGGGKKARGCCRRHPVGCGVTLLVVASLSLAVVGVALGIRSYLDKTFQDTVDQVYSIAVCS